MSQIQVAKVLFGQEAIKSLIQEKGGIITFSDLAKLTASRYPDTSLPRRVGIYVQRLRKWEEIACIRLKGSHAIYIYLPHLNKADVLREIERREAFLKVPSRILPRKS